MGGGGGNFFNKMASNPANLVLGPGMGLTDTALGGRVGNKISNVTGIGDNNRQGTTTSTTANEPWSVTQPYWKQIYSNIFGSGGGIGGNMGSGGRKGGMSGGLVGSGMGTPGPTTLNDGLGRHSGFDRLGYGGQTAANGSPQPGGNQGLLGNTQFVGANPNMQTAWNMVQNRAGQPSQLLGNLENYATNVLGGNQFKPDQTLQNAQGYANRVLSGEFLDPSKNLALAQQLQRGMQNIGNTWDTSAIQSGRYGGGAWAAGKGQQLADLQGNLYGQGLQQMGQMASLAPALSEAALSPERLRMQMAGMAPAIYEAGYSPAQKMLGLGESQRQLGQEEQMFPWEKYQMAANLLSQSGGGTSTTTNPYFKPNPLMGALGGAGVGSSIGGPWGAGIGGALGYLGSK